MVSFVCILYLIEYNVHTCENVCLTWTEFIICWQLACSLLKWNVWIFENEEKWRQIMKNFTSNIQHVLKYTYSGCRILKFYYLVLLFKIMDNWHIRGGQGIFHDVLKFSLRAFWIWYQPPKFNKWIEILCRRRLITQM